MVRRPAYPADGSGRAVAARARLADPTRERFGRLPLPDSDGRRTVLKASPGRARLAFEAFALEAWHTVHVPAVIAHDEELGALLIEAIEPGMPLDVSSNHPVVESVAELLSSLHGSGVPTYPSVGHRVAYLFDASAMLYERHPGLTALIPPELYERGRRLATRLARALRRTSCFTGT